MVMKLKLGLKADSLEGIFCFSHSKATIQGVNMATDQSPSRGAAPKERKRDRQPKGSMLGVSDRERVGAAVLRGGDSEVLGLAEASRFMLAGRRGNAEVGGSGGGHVGRRGGRSGSSRVACRVVCALGGWDGTCFAGPGEG
jgi:hypothetical protein